MREYGTVAALPLSSNLQRNWQPAPQPQVLRMIASGLNGRSFGFHTICITYKLGSRSS